MAHLTLPRALLLMVLLATLGCDFSGSPIINPRPDSIHIAEVPFAVTVTRDVVKAR